MPAMAVQALLLYEAREGVVLSQGGEALKLSVVKNGLNITVTVPMTILE